MLGLLANALRGPDKTGVTAGKPEGTGADEAIPSGSLSDLLLGASACFALMVNAVGAFYLLGREPDDYFPGDPPIADMVWEVAVVLWLVIAIGLFAHFALNRAHAAPRVFRRGRRVIALLTATSFVLLVPAFVQVGKRHFGEWGRLKGVLKQSEAQLLEVVRPQEEHLSDQETALAEAWFKEHPVMFKFEARTKPVQIRLMRRLPPYVGVDFGDGKNAVFELSTMLCIYSD